MSLTNTVQLSIDRSASVRNCILIAIASLLYLQSNCSGTAAGAYGVPQWPREIKIAADMRDVRKTEAQGSRPKSQLLTEQTLENFSRVPLILDSIICPQDETLKYTAKGYGFSWLTISVEPHGNVLETVDCLADCLCLSIEAP